MKQPENNKAFYVLAKVVSSLVVMAIVGSVFYIVILFLNVEKEICIVK